MSQQVEVACRAADTGVFDKAVRTCALVVPDEPEFAACQALIASVYRQVGLHQSAQAFDERGLRAPAHDDLGRAMCSLGLAADLVGVGDRAGARAALAAAAPAVAEVPAWHWGARWFDPWLTEAWVAAEVHLLSDEPDAAVRVLQPFADMKPRTNPTTRWPFERAKTLLFLGVAERCVGQPDAAGHLTVAARMCQEAGLDPLLLPAVEQLATLDPLQAAAYDSAVAAARRRMLRHRPPAP